MVVALWGWLFLENTFKYFYGCSPLELPFILKKGRSISVVVSLLGWSLFVKYDQVLVWLYHCRAGLCLENWYICHFYAVTKTTVSVARPFNFVLFIL